MKLIDVFYKNRVENSEIMLTGWGRNREYYAKALYAKRQPPLEHSGWAPLGHASYTILFWRSLLRVHLYGTRLSDEKYYTCIQVRRGDSAFICEKFAVATGGANQAVWSSDFMGYRKPRRKDKKRGENECY